MRHQAKQRALSSITNSLLEYNSFKLFLLKEFQALLSFALVVQPTFSKTLDQAKTMQQATLQRYLEPLQEEVTETKKSPDLQQAEESLSEFERARQCSKTWSMPQD